MQYRLIALFATLFLGLSSAFATGPKRTVVHNMDFILSQQSISVKSPKTAIETRMAMMELVVANGGKVESSFFKQFFAPTIEIKLVKFVAGSRGNNALSISVSHKKVLICYTTAESLSRALDLLTSSVTQKNGWSVIQGTDIIDWNETLDHKRTGDIDLTTVTSLMPKQHIEEFISRTKGGSELRLTMISKDGWIVESRTLESVNSSLKPYAPIGYYTLSQLKSLSDYANSKDIEISLGVDLLSPNETFGKITGFPLNSVEGMRFLRAMITEWSETTGITKFWFRKGEYQNDARYMEFIKFLNKSCNVNIEIE